MTSAPSDSIRLVRGMPDGLPIDTPTAVAFMDETGSISQDRFFAVGLLVIPEPSDVLRLVQKLRDRLHWYREIHWIDVTVGTIPIYSELMKIVASSNARFACFVADRQQADPVARFTQNPWLAYEKLATQLLIGASRRGELLTVLADNYSTPDTVQFELDVRRGVNTRLGRLVVASVCRLDSRSCDALQMVDVLTGAVTFEFRQQAGLAGATSPKARLAAELRNIYGVTTLLRGVRTNKLNVAIYRNAPDVAGPSAT